MSSPMFDCKCHVVCHVVYSMDRLLSQPIGTFTTAHKNTSGLCRSFCIILLMWQCPVLAAAWLRERDP